MRGGVAHVFIDDMKIDDLVSKVSINVDANGLLSATIECLPNGLVVEYVKDEA